MQLVKLFNDSLKRKDCKYTSFHNLEYQTSNGVIFSQKELEKLPVPFNLDGNALPWVESGKYLGNKLTNIQDGYQQDVKEKRAQ